METLEVMRMRLCQAFPDAEVRVSPWRDLDHLKIEVISPSFAGMARIERHRRVHAALGEWMQRVHAVRIVARAPEEIQGGSSGSQAMARKD